MSLAVFYIVTLVTFLGIDAVWLVIASEKLYRPALGDMLLQKPMLSAAIVFYLLYIGGLTLFVGVTALRTSSWTHAGIYGAAFGLVCYATYDLTNLATLRNWSVTLTIADLLWGTMLTGVASTVGYFVTTAIMRR
jgi:uncharacterized membrane protein